MPTVVFVILLGAGLTLLALPRLRLGRHELIRPFSRVVGGILLLPVPVIGWLELVEMPALVDRAFKKTDDAVRHPGVPPPAFAPAAKRDTVHLIEQGLTTFCVCFAVVVAACCFRRIDAVEPGWRPEQPDSERPRIRLDPAAVHVRSLEDKASREWRPEVGIVSAAPPPIVDLSPIPSSSPLTPAVTPVSPKKEKRLSPAARTGAVFGFVLAFALFEGYFSRYFPGPQNGRLDLGQALAAGGCGALGAAIGSLLGGLVRRPRQ